LKVLIVGSGGREHALAWRLHQSPQLTGLWVANGNAGTADIATNLGVSPEDIEGVVVAARSLAIDLVVIGPELPLAAGLVDRLSALGIPAFGPTKAAAQIEASKSFAREVMREAGVPGPEFWVFNDRQEALDFIRRHPNPVVVKADGLAAGKGVSLCQTQREAEEAVEACMVEHRFGPAGDTVVIEELLSGREVSVFAFTDGQDLSSLAAACDYKRVGDGDLGPNTGGMGSFVPPDFWDDALAEEISATIMRPVVEGMARRGTLYRGVLYAGIMLTRSGPKVLEFNCRFGDPEAQVILPLLESDPIQLMLACWEGRLAQFPVHWQRQAQVAVVMTSAGYPGKYDTGYEIAGLGTQDPHSLVFHAGTKSLLEGGVSKVVTNGGRVLTVVGRGTSLAEARTWAYDRLQGIHFEGAYYRSDIGDLPIGDREEAWAVDPAAQRG